jgi:lysophospholipase
MPPIPDQASYDAAGLGQKVSIFGCYSPEAVTIVYMPNTNISFPSGQSTYKMQYNATETQGMIANGELVATYNNAEDWPKCLACGIMAKTKLYANADMKTHANEASSVAARAADAECEPCLRKYCYS